MNIPHMKRYALACAALLGGVACLAGEVVLDEASSEPVGLNNLEVKTAATVENLKLPEAWGDTNAPTLVIEGTVTPAEGTNYVWQTGPLFPQYYTVKLTYGGEEYEALFDVAALAAAEWGTLDLDNVTPRVAKTTENLSLPAAWGEDATDLKLVWTDELGDHEQALDATAKSYAWSTLPLMPGAYNVKLTYGGTATTVASYTVASLGEGIAASGAAIDNAYDSDPAGEGVRDIANHTNVFKLAWVGAGTSELTLDGEATGAEPDTDGNWAWETNGLTYALYTFTNTVDGSNYVARFRVNADKIAVMFHEDTNDVLVAKSWVEDQTEAPDDASRKVLSDLLKEPGANGYALWKSYVLGITPATTLNLKSNIAVTNLPPDQLEITVWPTEKLTVPSGTQATIEYGIERTEDLGTPSWTRVKNLVTEGDVKYVETVSTNKVQRFYRTNLDVQPTPKAK